MFIFAIAIFLDTLVDLLTEAISNAKTAASYAPRLAFGTARSRPVAVHPSLRAFVTT